MRRNKTLKETLFKHEYNLQSSLNKNVGCNFVPQAKQYPLEKLNAHKSGFHFIYFKQLNQFILYHWEYDSLPVEIMNDFKIQKTKDHENCTLPEAFACAMLITGYLGFLPKRAIHYYHQRQHCKIIGIN